MKNWGVTAAAVASLAGAAIAQKPCVPHKPVTSEKLQNAIKLENLQSHLEMRLEVHKPVTSEKLQNAIKLENLQSHLETFEEIALGAPYMRLAGTPGYNETLEYVEEQLTELGDYYDIEKQTYVTYVEYHNDGEIAIGGETLDSQTFLYSKNVTLEGVQLIWVNSFGCNGTEDFPPEVEGNIALVIRGPAAGTGPTCPFAIKSANAGAAGAAGLVLFDFVPGAPPILGVLDVADPPQGPLVPTLAVSNEVGLDLASRLAAGEEITVDTFYTSTYGYDTYSQNLFATTTRGDPDNILFIGAHLDGVADGPGINDNGSGSVAILEVARQLARYLTNVTVRFGWWTAEESGLLGAWHYVETADPEELMKVRLYLNFDMVGSGNGVLAIYDGDGSAFGLEGPPGSAEAEALWEEYYTDLGLPYVPTAFDGRSDYGPFLAYNVPAGGLFTGADGIKTEEEAELFGGTAGIIYDPNYHSQYDTIGNLSYPFLEIETKAIAHAVATYANGFEGFPEREPPVARRGEEDSLTKRSICPEAAIASGKFQACNFA